MHLFDHDRPMIDLPWWKEWVMYPIIGIVILSIFGFIVSGSFMVADSIFGANTAADAFLPD